MTVADYPDYAEPQANATAISITGTPLLHGASRLASINAAVPAGSTVIQTIGFAKPGYLVNIRPQYSGASGVTPFARAHWRWVDANPGTLDLGEQDWTVPVHPAGVYSPVLGSGPVAGPFVQLELSNLDAGQPITFFADIWETTQHIARDDWRETELPAFQPAAGKLAAPGASPGANVLASFTTTLAAATNYMLPLYAGQAWLSAVITPLAGATATLQIQPYDMSALLYNSGSVAAASLFPAQPVALPRRPCLLSLFTAGGNTTFEICLTAMEYAS